MNVNEMENSQNYKLYTEQTQLDYQVKYEEEMKRKGLRREGAKFQQIRKSIDRNLPEILKKEQLIDENLDQITSFELDDRLKSTYP